MDLKIDKVSANFWEAFTIVSFWVRVKNISEKHSFHQEYKRRTDRCDTQHFTQFAVKFEVWRSQWNMNQIKPILIISLLLFVVTQDGCDGRILGKLFKKFQKPEESQGERSLLKKLGRRFKSCQDSISSGQLMSSRCLPFLRLLEK